jgi:alpha-glucoside transport system permease protein
VSTGVAAAPPTVPAEAPPGRLGRYIVAACFLAPAAVLLAVWIVYPTLYTIWRSLFDRSGSNFVWLDNYKSIFQDGGVRTAIKNNVIWILIVPAFLTAIGLVFAVLTERVRWAVAFKTVVFMPMAISLFATGVIWRIMYQQDPNQGVVNAAIASVADAVNPPGVLDTARPSTPAVNGSTSKGYVLKTPVQVGGTALLGLTAIPPASVPGDATQAAVGKPDGGIGGVVWRDFKPGGGKPGVVEQGEKGLPGVTVELRDGAGKKIASAKSAADGSFTFPKPSAAGPYRVAIGSTTFRQPYGGVTWLGSKLITPAIIIGYIWVWAGFAMVVIAAGLSAIPRDTLEAARTDGATEWQVFRRVTVPLLAPVLSVVFITLLINVLKVFDIVIAMAPGSSQSDAQVIALTMWRRSFGGVNDFGTGSAIAVFLFVLVIPVLALNIRRFRREV